MISQYRAMLDVLNHILSSVLPALKGVHFNIKNVFRDH
jgi:hypothetical protein